MPRLALTISQRLTGIAHRHVCIPSAKRYGDSKISHGKSDTINLSSQLVKPNTTQQSSS